MTTWRAFARVKSVGASWVQSGQQSGWQHQTKSQSWILAVRFVPALRVQQWLTYTTTTTTARVFQKSLEEVFPLQGSSFISACICLTFSVRRWSHGWQILKHSKLSEKKHIKHKINNQAHGWNPGGERSAVANETIPLAICGEFALWLFNSNLREDDDRCVKLCVLLW